MCVRIYTSQPANVRAYGACAAAGCNFTQKAALGPLFEVIYSQLQSLSFFGVRLIRTPMSGAALLPS